MSVRPHRDHGGGIDTAVEGYGGARGDWIDLSTGINPVPYPIPPLSADAWTALPDKRAQNRLTDAARRFWHLPDSVEVLAAPGASALIARMPGVFGVDTVCIPGPTYNEHAAAFRTHGVRIVEHDAALTVLVHPNNPDGRYHALPLGPCIIDESFCDISPEDSHCARAGRRDLIILKSFGKFWGLAGLRLGFAIGPKDLIDPLREALGPWPVSGPALDIGTAALNDTAWADLTRNRLQQDAERLDHHMTQSGAQIIGGTSLFRLYQVTDAQIAQTQLARRHIWSRTFPYSSNWLRLGLPAPDRWARVEAAIAASDFSAARQ